MPRASGEKLKASTAPAAVGRRSPSRRATPYSSAELTNCTANMNSRPAATAVAARSKAPVRLVQAASSSHPSGGWSYQ
jgi:hypothetical protein